MTSSMIQAPRWNPEYTVFYLTFQDPGLYVNEIRILSLLCPQAYAKSSDGIADMDVKYVYISKWWFATICHQTFSQRAEVVTRHLQY